MSLFVAVGHHGQRVVSENGADWEKLQLGKEGEVYRAAAAGGGVHVAVGNFGGKNIFAATRDGGATWTVSQSDAQYKYYLRSVVHGGGGFLGIGGDPGAVGSSAPFVLRSADGVTWSDYLPISGRNIITRVAWGNGMFVGVGDRGRRSMSKDGKEWKDVPAKAVDTLVDVTFGAGKFVGVGLHGLRSTTEDGLSWPHRFSGEEGEHINSVIWTGDRFVAVGQGGTYFSPDGLAWTRKESKDAPLNASFGAGVFVGTHWKGRILMSKDAVEWRQVYKAEHHLEAVAFG